MGLQRLRITSLSILAKPAISIYKQKPYAHGVIVLEVNKNDEGQVESIVAGSMRFRPQIEVLRNRMNFNLETIRDYDFFRVTNDSKEAFTAASKARLLGKMSSDELKIRWDPKGLAGLLFGRDLTKIDDKMTCIEYLNYLYDDKFHDPKEGTITPTHVFEYQEKIKRPDRLNK